MRFVCDPTWRWVDERAVMGGSPPHLFRLTEAGAAAARRVERGEDVDASPLVERFLDRGAIHPAPLRPGESVGADVSDVTVVTPQLGGRIAGDGRITIDDGSEPPLDGATIRLDENVGPSGARNAGRRAVTTPFVLFVDADVDVPALDPDHADHVDWWRALLRHFDDPSVGLVAPRVTGDDASSLDLGDRSARIRAGTRVSYVPGAALLVRVAAFDDVGGFDETLRVGEDVDLVWRLDEAGWRCRYEPASSVHHRPRSTWVARLGQQVKYGSSSGPLALRHPRSLAPYASRIGTAASLVGVAVGRPVAGLALAVSSAARAATTARSSGLDPRALAEVALVGQLAAGSQALVAIRRAWWPLLVPLLWSRRARRLVGVALLAPPRRVVNDLAFSVGLWRSVLAVRSGRALVPRIDLRWNGDGAASRSPRPSVARLRSGPCSPSPTSDPPAIAPRD